MNKDNSSWKTQVYVLGGVIGLVFGLLSSYLFARAAEEDVALNKGQVEPISTGQIVAASLTALGLARQISEMGKRSTKG